MNAPDHIKSLASEGKGTQGLSASAVAELAEALEKSAPKQPETSPFEVAEPDEILCPFCEEWHEPPRDLYADEKANRPIIACPYWATEPSGLSPHFAALIEAGHLPITEEFAYEASPLNQQPDLRDGSEMAAEVVEQQENCELDAGVRPSASPYHAPGAVPLREMGGMLETLTKSES